MRVHVWWSSLLAAGGDLLGLLDATERARVAALERSADQGRSMVAAALLRVAVADHLGAAPSEVVVDRTCADCGRPHGRPRVRGPGAVVPHVSVSHSGLLVLVALAPDAPVGVDVQRLADLGPGDGGDLVARGRDWARREAVRKVGRRLGEAAVRALDVPLDGYVAALASLTDHPPADTALVVRSWPDARGAPGAPDVQ